MPRQARLDSPGTLHHVMIRGIEGGRIFYDDEDRGNFLGRVGQVVERTGTRILAWVLMDNHVHLLLFSGPARISAFMRRLLTGYAVWFNRRHRRFGHLFQNRYKYGDTSPILTQDISDDFQRCSLNHHNKL